MIEMAIVIGLCNALGSALKRVPWLPNWSIPFILAMAGGASAAWRGDCTPDTVLSGIVYGLGAVGVHQALRQVTSGVKGGDHK